MDLREIEHAAAVGTEHWYYRAKAGLAADFLRRHLGGREVVNVVDVGAGSGLILRLVARELAGPGWRFVGYDPNYKKLPESDDSRICFLADLGAYEGVADVVLLMDVVEHVRNDHEFVRDILARLLGAGTRTSGKPLYIFATAPAHPFLMGAHDRYLGHFRRYTAGGLAAVFPQEVRSLASHYYYASVMPAAVPMRLWRRRSTACSDMRAAGRMVNSVLGLVLSLERRIARCNLLCGLSCVYGGYVSKLAESAGPTIVKRKAGKADGGGSWLVVVPAYCEGDRLPRLLDELVRELRKRPELRVKMLVVDDGSSCEQSRLMVRQVESSRIALEGTGGSLDLQRFEVNRGKGAVLREAFAAAVEEGRHNLIGFVDADGSTPFREVVRAYDFLESDADLDSVIGSRVKCLGNHVGRQWLRHFVGRAFATAVGMLFDIPVYDSQCGLKIFRREALVGDMLDRCRDNRWLFDTQLLLRLWFDGKVVKELPVEWHEMGGGKVSLLRDSVGMFVGLLRFWGELRRERG